MLYEVVIELKYSFKFVCSKVLDRNDVALLQHLYSKEKDIGLL